MGGGFGAACLAVFGSVPIWCRSTPLSHKPQQTPSSPTTNKHKQVYGDPKVHPQPESYWGNVNPIGPRACYDEGKRVAETMMYAYKAQVRFWGFGVWGVCVCGSLNGWMDGMDGRRW